MVFFSIKSLIHAPTLLIIKPKLSSKEMATDRSERAPSLVMLKKVVQIDYQTNPPFPKPSHDNLH
jgi:hypothetical protein